MLSPRDVQEMRALTERVAKGSVSREDWANLAALAVLYQGDETAVAIAAQGLDTFIAVSAPVYEGHGFQHDDYCRMFDRICAAAARYARDRVH